MHLAFNIKKKQEPASAIVASTGKRENLQNMCTFSHIIARNLFLNTGMPKKAWIISWDTPLLVGTMVEWGNYWAKAIRMRDYKQTEAYAGMFSQIGELYNVKVW